MNRPLFELGEIVATTNAMAALEARGLTALLQTAANRHVLGDWGDLCEEDRQLNEEAVKTDGRLMSVYRVDNALTLWVITEWDRSYTTILLPEDY